MTIEAHEHPSYQRMMRAIGATLDDKRPARFTIIEIPEGFTLVWELRDPAPVLEEVHFSQATLMEMAGELTRGPRSSPRGRPHEALPTGPGYENVLRALGFEFDDSLAHSILVSEIEGGLLLTYSYVDSSQGYAWRKHMVRLDTADIEQMLDAARDRRRRRKLLGFIR